MCGISGAYFREKINKKELEAIARLMDDIQKKRGPDDRGSFIGKNGNLVFGHRRLSFIDLSKAGHQPMMYRNKELRIKNKECWITFNGEIYNFLELKKGLESRGHKFKTKSDTEVILALYAEHGEKSFGMLRGMFAFGLWDETEQKVYLVKDRYGIKPLYYWSDRNRLIFASTVRAIQKTGIIPIQKESKAMIGFLLFGSVPLPMTTIKGILAIPAGHYLVRDSRGVENIVKYYDPLKFYQHKSAEISINQRSGAENQWEEAVSETRRLLNESVGLHLISDAPLGIFLSGGLDSSVIAAMAAQNYVNNQHKSAEISINPRLTTLSIKFKEEEFSEEKYQRIVAQKIGSDHKEIEIGKEDFFGSFREIFEAMDQPTIDGVNTFFIAKAAKEAGLKAVLSGLGADEIFFGYPSFKKAAALRKISALPAFLKAPPKFIIDALSGKSLIKDRYSKASYLFSKRPLDFYLGIRGLFSPYDTAKMLDIDVSEVYGFINGLSHNYSIDDDSVAGMAPADLLSYLELKFYLQNQLLKDTDFMAMEHSVEVRVPFLDHKLVEYVSSLPVEFKLHRHKSAEISMNPQLRINKPLLTEAARDLLPPEILSRKKMGFTFPFSKWLREADHDVFSRLTGYSDYGLANQFKKGNLHWSRFWALYVMGKLR
ncbi:MAG: asparagine synthase (glutamine-hydrolyzing) [Candidatus Wolfebacteria bacterium]|nr:asparagine synthase (glutamine-hydrolyzing) [Candidatus Wolfebacteria bacterium]